MIRHAESLKACLNKMGKISLRYYSFVKVSNTDQTRREIVTFSFYSNLISVLFKSF